MYSEKDFGNLQFNPLNKKKLLEAYPQLTEIVPHEHIREPNLDNLLRYIIIVTDPRSKLVKEEKDLNYRKGIAAELAQLNVEDEEYIQSIYSFANTACLEITVKYLMRFARSKEFAALCAYEYSFWESVRKILEPISGKTSKEELESVQKKATIKEEIDKDVKRLDAYYKAFFGDDELEGAVKETRWTPESVAKKFK